MRRVLLIAPESYPQIKVGGLGKVVAGVSRALGRMGIDLRVITPRENIYQRFDRASTKLNYQRLGWRARKECQKDQWWPDWLWLHDWGAVWSGQAFLSQPIKQRPKVLWTIHSPVGEEDYDQYQYQSDDQPIDWGDSFFDFQGLINQGISLADQITTVSSGYARRLSRHHLFQSAREIIGLPNAIDQTEWEPRTDRLIAVRLEGSWPEFKERNKQVLQRQFGLPQESAPVFCFVSRMVPQKGVDLLIRAMREFLAKNRVQLIVVGSGQPRLCRAWEELRQDFPDKVGLKLVADFDLPHQVFAGSDFLVLPSRAEPFGLVVAEARKYGVIPIVHLVDGLIDQVRDQGNGFGFRAFTKASLLTKLYQALSSWSTPWWQNRLSLFSASVGSWDSRAQDWLKLILTQAEKR